MTKIAKKPLTKHGDSPVAHKTAIAQALCAETFDGKIHIELRSQRSGYADWTTPVVYTKCTSYPQLVILQTPTNTKALMLE